MVNRKSYLKEDTLEWLLEGNNPSVRYFTLTGLMGKRSDSSEVKAAKAEIMTGGPVPGILDKQNPAGYWKKPSSFYLPKYRATVWSLSILAELGADGNDERIKQACEYILENSQHFESGAFSHISYKRYIYQKKKKDMESPFFSGSDIKGGSPNIIPCLTGNMLFSLIRCGYLKDPRVQKGIEWINRYQRFDDAIEQASEYFLMHHIYKRSHDLRKIAIPAWMHAGFPLSGFLAVLSVLFRLGYKDDRMQDAVDLLIKKQNKNGRWLMEASLNSRMHVNIEKKGRESKWITLYALSALKNFYG